MGTIKKHIFTIGISILALAIVIYGISTFYPDPLQECYPRNYANTEQNCMAGGGEWMQSGGMKPVPADGGYCDYTKKCEPLRDTYDRNISLIAYTIGLLLLLYGIRGKRLAEQTTAGFVGGGLLIIIYGTIRYWSHLSDGFRFFVVLAIFGFLIWIGNKYKDYFK